MAPLVHQPTSTKSMHGGPVLPAITEPHQQDLPGSNESSLTQKRERNVSETSLAEESPAKKPLKWTPEEDNCIIELRGQGMKWDDIAERLPGRSPTSCRLRYQNYLEKRAVWDEEKKSTLARIYARCVKLQIPRIFSVLVDSLNSIRCSIWDRVLADKFD